MPNIRKNLTHLELSDYLTKRSVGEGLSFFSPHPMAPQEKSDTDDQIESMKIALGDSLQHFEEVLSQEENTIIGVERIIREHYEQQEEMKGNDMHIIRLARSEAKKDGRVTFAEKATHQAAREYAAAINKHMDTHLEVSISDALEMIGFSAYRVEGDGDIRYVKLDWALQITQYLYEDSVQTRRELQQTLESKEGDE
jgi:hypothetical protein